MPLPPQQFITFLHTPDLARTADFYERVLGLRLARDQGACRIYQVAGDAYLGFCRQGEVIRPDAGDALARVVLTLVTDDVDAWCAHLAAHGVPLEKAPADNPPYRITNAFVRDPNGYLVEIQRFWEPLE